MQKKVEKLERILKKLGSVVVAFSGGCDSTFLLYTALRVLGKKVIAVTADSPTYSREELQRARKLAKKLKVKLVVVNTREFENKKFKENSTERCYYCKKELFGILKKISAKYGFNSVADGTTLSDLSDFRPGMKAAREAGVFSPLLEAGLTKEEIKKLSRKARLPTWNAPAMACLASRFPFGTKITPKSLKKVYKAERAIKKMGFENFRVRYHGTLARLEFFEEEIATAIKKRSSLVRACKKAGFKYVTIDLEGYVPSGKR